MAWNTTVIIIVENIESRPQAEQLGKLFFDRDSKCYGAESFYILKDEDSYAVWYTYQRSKYLPDWIIKDQSENHPTLQFTLLGTSLQFNCGPGGIVRIQRGIELDSYGITPDDSIRKVMLLEPEQNKELIYHWYKWQGQENKLRSIQLDKIPLGTCDGGFAEKMIYVEEGLVKKEVEATRKITTKVIWEKQEQFQLHLSHDEYLKNLESNPLHEQTFSEENILSYIAYSPVIKEIEKKVYELTQDAHLAEIHPYITYSRIFNVRSFDNYAYRDEFSSIGKLDAALKDYKEDIIFLASKNLCNEKVSKVIHSGIAITWFISILDKIKIVKSKFDVLEVETSFHGQNTDLPKEIIESYPKLLQHVYGRKIFGENFLALPNVSDPIDYQQPFHFVNSAQDVSVFEQEFRTDLPEEFILLGYLYGRDPFILFNKKTSSIHSVYVTDFIDAPTLKSKLSNPICTFDHFLNILNEQTVTSLINPKKLSKYATIEIRKSQLYFNYDFIYDGPNLREKYLEILKEEIAKGLEINYAPYWVHDTFKATK